MWLYKSPIGPIYIVQLYNGRYGMKYNGTVWESCDTPQAQADNVYCQCTGCADWDLFNAYGHFVPSSLDEWEKV